VVGYFEQGNESSVSNKVGGFLDGLNNY